MNNFQPDNELELSKDSYIYSKQLLKTSINVDGKTVRPFLVFAYLEAKLGFLTFDEFAYLLPLCTDKDATDKVAENILKYRMGKITFDEILIAAFMSMNNYKIAYDYFCRNEVTEELICAIGMNRKSKGYDKTYFKLYKLLKRVVLQKDEESIIPLLEMAKKLSGKPKSMWVKHLFATSVLSVVKKRKFEALNENEIFMATNIQELNKVFFERMHLYKMMATLADYMDLNRRYFKITDTVLFSDRKVEFDILPKCYFGNVADELIAIAFQESDDLTKNVEIEEIAPRLAIDEKALYVALGRTVGTKVESAEQAKVIIKDERYVRLNKLIDEKFSKSKLIELFAMFEERNDSNLRNYITDNADVPTMFEYVIGIAWYLISDRQGDILENMNLSLEADLLPKTHAGGGEADIVYQYRKTEYYPEHTLLIEATLSEKTGQRKMEMEPVSRHLGDYKLKNPDKETYCLFVATFVHLNIIQDFRLRKNAKYFGTNTVDVVDGLKIVSLQTSEIKTILEKDIRYSQLYPIFDRAHNSNVDITEWYKNEIVGKI